MTSEHITGKLLENAVIVEGVADADGARRPLPDARSRHRAASRPPRHVSSADAAALQHRIEQFLFYQAELLDRRCWREYIDLFTVDGIYWMPVSADQQEWLDSPSIFIEDRPMMEVRMGRVMHPNAWSQAPMWATSHIVGSVVIESLHEAQVEVRSRFQMMELYRDSVRQFAGSYRHTLVRTGEEFRILLQRVDLTNGEAVYDYVLQIWV